MSETLANARGVAALVLAGGSGSRMAGRVADKTLETLAGKPVLLHSIDAFIASGCVQRLVIVTRNQAQRDAIAERLADCPLPLLWANGGAQRQDSVNAGLQALPHGTEIVLIHDGARPLVTPEAIQRSVAAARASGAACLARRVTDTIKLATPTPQTDAYRPETLDRSLLWAMETPQTFSFPLIRDAYEKVIASGAAITDDLSAIEAYGHSVVFIDNGRPNLKITHPDDFAHAEALLAANSNPTPSNTAP